MFFAVEWKLTSNTIKDTGTCTPPAMRLEVRLGYLDSIDVHDVLLEPALLVGDGDVVPAHLALAHEAGLVEGPVFETVRAVPLLPPGCGRRGFVPLIEKLPIVSIA